MANPSGFGADAAYDRAVAAFSQQSFDVARRWVLEALAQNPEHAGARALLGRLDSVRRPPNPAPRPAASRPSPYGSPAHAGGSETVSTDPTVLINHASRTPAPDGIEPTVLVQRDHQRRPPAPDPFAPVRSPMHDTAPTSEPTVIKRPSEPPPPARPRTAPAAGGGFLQKWRDLFGGPRVAAPRPAPRTARAGGLSPQMRGAALVLGAVVAAALLLAVGVAAVRWMWPAGQKLTLTPPTGGTIFGPGIKCGTKGDDCSTERPTGDVVELEARPDSGFLFTGFTGDCAPAGRISMSAPHKCGATFDAVAPIPKATTFSLTVDKPVGGTIATDVGTPNILCGALGDVCATEVPAGVPVAMHMEPASGFAFQAYTKDCAGGEMIMNAAKTCGAIFMKTETPVVSVAGPPVTRNTPGRDRGKAKADEKTNDPGVDAGPKGPVLPPPPPPGPQPGQQQQPPVTSTVPSEPAKAPMTAEQHAKEEIEALVKSYCSANETLKPEAVQKLFPLAPMVTYREQFRQYQTLKCVITSKPEFQRLDASATGGAQVLFGMKQVIQMKSGGAPKVYETNVTMVVSRTSFQAPWLIDRLVAEKKPE
jgi:hypothetical protein